MLADYEHEVEHQAARAKLLENAIDSVTDTAPPELRAVVDALQALRGIAKISAVTVACEVGQFSRFAKATQLMAYTGIVSREHSSGQRVWRGGITKTGNDHLRRIVIEAAWAYRHRPAIWRGLAKRQEKLPDEVKAIAWKAQHRLNDRYRRLVARGKSSPHAVTAVARELLGFMWAIGVWTERSCQQGRQAA